MGKAEKRELVSRLTVLLVHLLKWQFQPSRRGASWEVAIVNKRLDVADHLQDNPSLKAMLDEAISGAYERARNSAKAETGLPKETFPATCPWTFEQIMDAEFWPAGQ